MAAPGWYPDQTMAATQRYWDGQRWTDHVAPLPAATAAPPTPQPRRRADGTLKGPSLGASIGVLLAGVVLAAVGIAVVVPAFVDSLSGPRWSVPGSHRGELETGTWMVYERVGTGGFGDFGGFGSVGAGDVWIEGPAPVSPRPDTGARETITINEREYVGVVRFDIEVAGTYEVSVFGEPSETGEVMLSRPIGDLFDQWPWFLAIVAGGIVAVAGVVMWIVGGVNRGRAKRADAT